MKKIKKELAEVFAELGIEYFSSIKMSGTKIIKPHLLEKLDFVPECAIVYLVPYYTVDGENISSYAVSRDYHIFSAEAGNQICEFLKMHLGVRSQAFCDHSPIDERDAAARCSLGIIGDNNLLINEKYGSYVFIGEIFTEATSDLLDSPEPVSPDGCIHCGRCLSACPRSASGGECLSALTQRKGELTDREREYIRSVGSAWGCDICQRVCPYNRLTEPTPIEFFRQAVIPRLTGEVLESMSDDEFSRRAYSWRGKRTVERNLEILGGDS